MRLSKLYIAILATCFCFTASAQAPFKRTYGAVLGYNDGRSLAQTPDSGYILLGSASGFGSGAADVLIIKTDKNGVQQWIKPFGWGNVDIGNNIKATQDGNFIFCGYTNSKGFGGYDVLLVKMDVNGDTLWSKTYGGADWDFGYKVQPTSDGGYIIAGETYSYGNGYNDFYIVKTDANGTMQWQQTVGTDTADIGRSVIETFDGHFIVAGYTSAKNTNGTNDPYIAKLTAGGDTVFTRIYQRTGDDYANDITATPDSGYATIGNTEHFFPGNPDLYLMRFNKNDDTLFTNFIHSVGFKTKMFSIVAAPNNKYAIAGETTPQFEKPFALMYNLHYDGNVNFGVNMEILPDEERFNEVILTNDGGYAMIGTTKSVGPGLNAVILMKIDGSGNTAGSTVVSVPEQTDILSVPLSPNPTTGQVTIKIKNNAKSLSLVVFNTLGQQVYGKSYTGTSVITEDFSTFDNGLYLVQIIADGSVSSQRLVLAK